MRARFLIENPDDITCTMKLTMTVKEWTELRDQLTEQWPSWDLSRAITSVISQARKIYYEEQDG